MTKQAPPDRPRVDPTRGADVKRWLQRVEAIRRNSTVCEVILIGHTIKSGAVAGGAPELQGGVDTLWTMSKTKSGKRQIKVDIRAAVGITLGLPPVPTESRSGDAPNPSAEALSPQTDRVLRHVQSAGSCTKNAARRAASLNPTSMDRVCEQLFARKLVEEFAVDGVSNLRCK